MHPYADETDLPAIAHLINACEAFDKVDSSTSVDALRQEFAHPDLDTARNVCLWRKNDGTLVGLSALAISRSTETSSGCLNFHVHPGSRGTSIETQMVTWGEQQLRAVGEKSGRPLQLQAVSRVRQGDRPVLLERHGFIADRYFVQMSRSLAEPIPMPEFPAGFALRYIEGDHEAADWVAMFNETFIDHGNHHPMTVEQFSYGKDPAYNPTLDLIAIAPDRTFAAFCNASCREDNRRSGRNKGTITLLGTRRGFRKQGLGRAMLLSGLQRLKAIGAETALLRVDSDNPFGASRLYTSVGFSKLHTTVVYTKEVRHR
ncbi:GNAT family N-acetyltransferase [Stenomitos frigidus ULC18]|uniref:GNAT family N-acetyltransferase n=2 Tax=Stenomitos TaxID=1844270 RepID=A0A2T1E3Q2_9CYAN|nr:GNAT family N-acetyltransferase [Stenomitos frigidus ULC18]